MEEVLEVYRLPHDPRFPVVCMDESSKQLVGEVTAPIAMAPGRGRIMAKHRGNRTERSSGQCLNRRIADIPAMQHEVAAWQRHRNQRGAPINWRFTTEDARIKLIRLYPKL